jgi:hypothetical protein
MSRSSDLHLSLSDYERMFGEQDEDARADFALRYSKGLLPSQSPSPPCELCGGQGWYWRNKWTGRRVVCECYRVPCDDTDPNQPSDD